MASETVTSFSWVISTSSRTFPKSSQLTLQIPLCPKITSFPLLKTKTHLSKFSALKPRAALEEKDQQTTSLLLQEEQTSKEVKDSVKVLKNAAKTRQVASEEVLAALAVIEKAKLDPCAFLNTLGGSESPGRTWMLIFTAKDRLKRGSYFPITAVQRFDAAFSRLMWGGPVHEAPANAGSGEGKMGRGVGAIHSLKEVWMVFLSFGNSVRQCSFVVLAVYSRCLHWLALIQAKRIENGVYLGPLGSLTFEGGFSWKKRILAFIFEHIRIKVGPFGPLQFSLGQRAEREPSTKDPFFIWFYVDEEIAVAQGRSGGTAFWCRCRRVT